MSYNIVAIPLCSYNRYCDFDNLNSLTLPENDVVVPDLPTDSSAAIFTAEYDAKYEEGSSNVFKGNQKS